MEDQSIYDSDDSCTSPSFSEKSGGFHKLIQEQLYRLTDLKENKEGNNTNSESPQLTPSTCVFIKKGFDIMNSVADGLISEISSDQILTLVERLSVHQDSVKNKLQKRQKRFQRALRKAYQHVENMGKSGSEVTAQDRQEMHKLLQDVGVYASHTGATQNELQVAADLNTIGKLLQEIIECHDAFKPARKKFHNLDKGTVSDTRFIDMKHKEKSPSAETVTQSEKNFQNNNLVTQRLKRRREQYYSSNSSGLNQSTYNSEESFTFSSTSGLGRPRGSEFSSRALSPKSVTFDDSSEATAFNRSIAHSRSSLVNMPRDERSSDKESAEEFLDFIGGDRLETKTYYKTSTGARSNQDMESEFSARSASRCIDSPGVGFIPDGMSSQNDLSDYLAAVDQDRENVAQLGLVNDSFISSRKRTTSTPLAPAHSSFSGSANTYAGRSNASEWDRSSPRIARQHERDMNSQVSPGRYEEDITLNTEMNTKYFENDGSITSEMTTQHYEKFHESDGEGDQFASHLERKQLDYLPQTYESNNDGPSYVDIEYQRTYQERVQELPRRDDMDSNVAPSDVDTLNNLQSGIRDMDVEIQELKVLEQKMQVYLSSTPDGMDDQDTDAGTTDMQGPVKRSSSKSDTETGNFQGTFVADGESERDSIVQPVISADRTETNSSFATETETDMSQRPGVRESTTDTEGFFFGQRAAQGTYMNIDLRPGQSENATDTEGFVGSSVSEGGTRVQSDLSPTPRVGARPPEAAPYVVDMIEPGGLTLRIQLLTALLMLLTWITLFSLAKSRPFCWSTWSQIRRHSSLGMMLEVLADNAFSLERYDNDMAM